MSEVWRNAGASPVIGLSIDPGGSNGACLFTYGERKAFKVMGVFQFPHGAHGLAAWLNQKNIHVENDGGGNPFALHSAWGRLDTLVVEKFTPRTHEGFKLTLDSVEPLRGEGVLIGRGLESFIDWAPPSAQYFMGDQRLPLPEKKKLARAFLKEHGMLPTGKTVGQPDANDAVSATLHAIAWMRRTRHMPTLLELFGEEEQ